MIHLKPYTTFSLLSALGIMLSSWQSASANNIKIATIENCDAIIANSKSDENSFEFLKNSCANVFRDYVNANATLPGDISSYHVMAYKNLIYFEESANRESRLFSKPGLLQGDSSRVKSVRAVDTYADSEHGFLILALDAISERILSFDPSKSGNRSALRFFKHAELKHASDLAASSRKHLIFVSTNPPDIHPSVLMFHARANFEAHTEKQSMRVLKRLGGGADNRFNKILSLAVDDSSSELLVLNENGNQNEILVFDLSLSSSTPKRIISGHNTRLGEVSSIGFDAKTNRITAVGPSVKPLYFPANGEGNISPTQLP